MAALCAAPAAVPGSAAAQSASASVGPRASFTAPAGWSRSSDGDSDVLSPAGDAGAAAQILVIAPKPVAGDFDRQFTSERAALEQFWGLRAATPVAPQRGQAASGPYAAYFASYDSDGGPRYMSFLATAQQQRFAMVVFVAASHDAFNRLAPQATELFTTLRMLAR
ncbi:MAG: hypothetical protein U1E89_21985 [Burkholderiaceae bacterium]